MNDFGLVQLIWIKRLVSETSRINTLIECGKLSKRDLNRYKSIISSIDEFCAFVVESQNWNDVENLSNIVDEVEMVLFQHFYEQIDVFEDEKVHLDFSSKDGDEVSLKFENPFIENISFGVIDDETFELMHEGSEDIGAINSDNSDNSVNSVNSVNEVNRLKDFIPLEDAFSGPILEGDILMPHEGMFIEEKEDNPIDSVFEMGVGESCEMSLEDFIALMGSNQENLSFTLCSDESDGFDPLGEAEVSFEEFIAKLLDKCSKKASKFEIIVDDDDFE